MMQKQCPFSGKLTALSHHKQAAAQKILTLRELAADISKRGFGPESRMTYESLVATEIRNRDLPQIHAEEGAKFAAIADKVAPPDLVADKIQEYSRIYPAVTPLEPRHICKAFNSILQTTDTESVKLEPGKAQFYRYDFLDSKNYFTFCAKEAGLFLACFYLSLSLQHYVKDLEALVADKDIGSNMLKFGKQFDASNLVTLLPIALCKSLLKLRGIEAKSIQVDQEVIFDAFKFLHDSGQFTVIGNGIKGRVTEGEQAVLRCPMEGYLFNLLCKHEVLQPIIAAIDRANYAVKQQHQAHPIAQKLLEIHKANSITVNEVAHGFLQTLLKRG